MVWVGSGWVVLGVGVGSGCFWVGVGSGAFWVSVVFMVSGAGGGSVASV